MVKGCEKRIVYLKNTGSPMFCEAYFVINESYAKRMNDGQQSIVKEAERLIEESLNAENKSFRKRLVAFLLRVVKKWGVSFIFGVLISAVVILIIK